MFYTFFRLVWEYSIPSSVTIDVPPYSITVFVLAYGIVFVKEMMNASSVDIDLYFVVQSKAVFCFSYEFIIKMNRRKNVLEWKALCDVSA